MKYLFTDICGYVRNLDKCIHIHINETLNAFITLEMLESKKNTPNLFGFFGHAIWSAIKWNSYSSQQPEMGPHDSL